MVYYKYTKDATVEPRMDKPYMSMASIVLDMDLAALRLRLIPIKLGVLMETHADCASVPWVLLDDLTPNP